MDKSVTRAVEVLVGLLMLIAVYLIASSLTDSDSVKIAVSMLCLVTIWIASNIALTVMKTR